MNDITDLIKYKFEAGINNIHNDEHISVEKSLFHDDVLNYLEHLEDNESIVTFTKIMFKDLSTIKEQFGKLWYRDYFTSYYRLIREMMNPEDVICRCSEESLLIFWHFPDEGRIAALINTLNNYKHEMFKIQDGIKIQTINVKISNEKMLKLKEDDHIYVEYMKLLSKINTHIDTNEDNTNNFEF